MSYFRVLGGFSVLAYFSYLSCLRYLAYLCVLGCFSVLACFSYLTSLSYLAYLSVLAHLSVMACLSYLAYLQDADHVDLYFDAAVPAVGILCGFWEVLAGA